MTQWQQIGSYCVFDVEPVPDAVSPNVMRVRGMVEKPKAEDAPSPYAAAGRYVLDRAIFDALRRVSRGAGGEIQLTDALDALAAQGRLVGYAFEGERYDAGDRLGYVKANIAFALKRPELRDGLLAYIRQIASGK